LQLLSADSVTSSAAAVQLHMYTVTYVDCCLVQGMHVPLNQLASVLFAVHACLHLILLMSSAHMYDVIKTSVNGELKLQKCLGLPCGKTMVARFVSCDFWNDKRAIVHNAIALFLQKAWRIRNAYKHGLADIDVADGVVSASMRRGADGIDARA